MVYNRMNFLLDYQKQLETLTNGIKYRIKTKWELWDWENTVVTTLSLDNRDNWQF